MRPSITKLVTVLAATLTVSAVAPAPAQASVAVTPDTTVKVGGGGVHALAEAGGRTYVGGLFTTVGVQRSNVAAITADGKVDPVFDPGTNGRVTAVAVSEDGAVVYLGGTFTQVGGVARANLAAVDASTGAVLGSWQADTGGTSPDVQSLAIDGNRLYVSGRFGTIDGLARSRFAALDATTGDPITGFRPRPNGYVREVVVSPDGSTVYAAGGFTTLSGQPRLRVGAVDAATGAPSGFSPSGDGGNAVTIDVSPDGSRVFYGTENNTLFAYDPAASNDPVWSLKTSGNTQAIEVVDDEMWIGGHFSQIVTGKIPRPYLASIDPSNGSVNAWDSQCTGGKQGVWALQHDGQDLHVGGYFAAFGAVKQRGYAQFSVTPRRHG